ncbi:uncharacterized protein LOC122366457 [Amphibalanus amphitrite]|uniref:uncharacterized protein LOC122363365 n=1 Tax=Amphibalanus amphitrite TaxID=1232801 RepID=UPI001C90202B|nr:uncharacterized protein LOC122363365 [Amphibalanus amphitrite]XP_043194680.1 uncharacterized protein LOC122366457 [Amphibalanus amphitrite]
MASRALLVAVLGLTALALAEAYPRPQSYERAPPVYRPVYEPEPEYRPSYEPVIEERAGYGKPSLKGRVKIQTYRGPSKGYGYDVFAPWGYYVTQPEDDKGYGYH